MDNTTDNQIPEGFNKPIVKLFTITGVIGFVTLVIFIIYYILNMINKRKEARQDKRTYSLVSSGSKPTSRQKQPSDDNDLSKQHHGTCHKRGSLRTKLDG